MVRGLIKVAEFIFSKFCYYTLIRPIYSIYIVELFRESEVSKATYSLGGYILSLTLALVVLAMMRGVLSSTTYMKIRAI